jgi:AraC-like DNA-binding protein
MLTQWEKLKAVQRMQDYVEAHLTRRISMKDLARAARYSPWHAARLFKEITGTPPFEHIRLRRLSVASERIRDGNERIVDVALDFDFASHEGFTRAFARQFGMSPQYLRKTQTPVEPFLPKELRHWYLRKQRGETEMSQQKLQTVYVQVLDRPARKMILKRAKQATHYFEYCEEVGCEVWNQLAAIEEALQEPLGLWFPANLRPSNTSEYVQGVEIPIDYAGPVPDGFEVVELSPCKMMVFQGPPFENKDFEQAIESLWDVMKAYKPETYGFCWADADGPRFQLRPEGYRGYIEGRPVRSV